MNETILVVETFTTDTHLTDERPYLIYSSSLRSQGFPSRRARCAAMCSASSAWW